MAQFSLDQGNEVFYPNMEIAQNVFEYGVIPEGPEKEQLKARILMKIVEDKMGPFCEVLASQNGWIFEPSFVENLVAQNQEEAKKFDDDMKNAQENFGEIEVLDIMFAKARFFSRIGSKEKAYEAYDEIHNKPKTSSSRKIEALLDKTRMALFYLDNSTMKELLRQLSQLIEDVGDWDKRNRFKVYEAIHHVLNRNFVKAAELLLDGIATFTCVELLSFKQFIFYAVITNLLYLPRMRLKKNIINSPEVISLMHELPAAQKLSNSLYDCNYDTFFRAIIEVNDLLTRDRYFSHHIRYLMREFRILAYKQFLDAYKSVTLCSMAENFGVSVKFIDQELSKFIAEGRLNAKIDKFGGVIETNRPDKKNAQYQLVIKQGDALLNRIQKLSRVVDV